MWLTLGPLVLTDLEIFRVFLEDTGISGSQGNVCEVILAIQKSSTSTGNIIIVLMGAVIILWETTATRVVV